MADDMPEHYRVVTPAPLLAPTVIVETGAIVPNANCYIDVAYANAFHDATVYDDAWENADADTRTKAIINATRAIDANMNFNGYLVDPMQPLKWPRLYCPQEDVYTGYPYGGYPIGMGQGAYGYWPSDMIPKIHKDANAQQALEILRVDRLSDSNATGIASMTVDVISLTFKQGSGNDAGGAFRPLSDLVAAMLAPLGTVTSEGGFATIPVVRVP
jgi:hypothetical protein